MQAQHDVTKIETKVKNVRFLGELTKFGVCPPQTALECLKTCLDSFQGHNVEIVAHFLEGCGRFLARLEESRLKFNTLLEFLLRLKESKLKS